MTGCERVHQNLFRVIAGASGVLATLVVPAGAMAQGALPERQIGQATEQRSFNIPPQPLQSALILFGQQSGRTIAADGATVRGLSSPGVQGTMSIDEALRRLLTGTGLTADGTSGSTITVQKQGAGLAPGALQLDPVQVQGAFPVPSQAMIDNLPPPYAGGQVATGGQLGLLGNRDVMDTPFNQTNYTAKKAQDQQAKTVQEVLIDDPSARVVRTDTGPGSDTVRMRGFQVDASDMSYGGLYGILPSYNVMAELAERVEVLKGPNAMLNGMSPNGAIGGAINIVPKRAPNEPLTQLTASYVSGAQFGAHADVARRFGPDQQFGVRFNGVFRDGQTDVKWNTDERALGVLGLDFRGDRARFSADFGYQSRSIGGVVGYLGLAARVPLPWAPNVRSNPAGQPWGLAWNKDLFGVFRGEIDLADDVTAYVSIGAHDNRFGGQYASYASISNVNGNAALNNVITSSYASYRTADAGFRAVVHTGPIDHQLAFTATTYDTELGSGTTSGARLATNIYNPTVFARPNLATPVASKASTSTLSSLGLVDTLSAAEKRIQLTVGARLQRVIAANFDATNGMQTDSYDASTLSPSVLLVVKPWQNVSVYGNWIQGLQQGTVVGTIYQNAGDIFPPYKSTQYEVGVKVDWGKFTTTANIFQISQPSTIAIPGPVLPTLALNGEQRNRGLELNVFGEPLEGVRLLGGIMFLSPVLTQTADGTNDGWLAPFSPQLNINLSGEWDLPFVRGLTLNGRAIYTGSQYIDTTWPRRSLPEWTRFDLGARYVFENPGATGKLLVARFNVENVLDANYWMSGNNAFTLNLGAPRTYRLSLTADF
jgi:iron complex outermembrane receptor protein